MRVCVRVARESVCVRHNVRPAEADADDDDRMQALPLAPLIDPPSPLSLSLSFSLPHVNWISFFS